MSDAMRLPGTFVEVACFGDDLLIRVNDVVAVQRWEFNQTQVMLMGGQSVIVPLPLRDVAKRIWCEGSMALKTDKEQP